MDNEPTGLANDEQQMVEQIDAEEARYAIKLYSWIGLVIAAHVFVIWQLFTIFTGITLRPNSIASSGLLWAATNGALIGMAIHAVKSGRLKVPGGWATGWRAIVIVAVWLMLSFFWFVVPDILAWMRNQTTVW
jgi:hypothetical protein